jgi:hypothetical protein
VGDIIRRTAIRTALGLVVGLLAGLAGLYDGPLEGAVTLGVIALVGSLITPFIRRSQERSAAMTEREIRAARRARRGDVGRSR